jgi:hypothetical protein
MRTHNKYFLSLILILTVVLILVACTHTTTNITKDDNKDLLPLNKSETVLNHNTIDVDIIPESEIIKYKPQYFFVDGHLLGSYDEDGWHSFCDASERVIENGIEKTEKLYVKDLLNQDSYYAYGRTKLFGESKIITLDAVAFETEDVVKLAKYGQNSTDQSNLTFKLPVKLGDELSKLEMPWNGMVFVMDFNIDGQYNGLVTNSGVNLFPREITYGVEPTPEGKRALLDLFKENNMENTIPNFTECVRGDFNGDGKEEYLMTANTPKDNGSVIIGAGKKDKLGTFSAVLYQDENGNIQVLDSIMEALDEDVELTDDGRFITDYINHSHTMELSNIIDLNNDGVMEIIFSTRVWDCGWYFTFSRNEQGKYTAVMGSDWG